MKTVIECSRSFVAYAGPLAWNVKWIFKVVHGALRAVDIETWNGCSRLCVAYFVPLLWNVGWMFTVVRGECRTIDMKCGLYVHDRTLRI